MGETPGEAVRLLTAAESGAVVVDEATRRLTGALFEWADLGELPLRGAPHAAHAWRVLGQSAIESRFEALRAPRLSPLVGREEELELLLRRWRAAVAGEGHAALVCGEPGIGKSRLMAELVQRLGSEPHEVLRYFCSPYQKDTPLYPITVQWERGAGFVRGDSGNERLQKLQAMMGPDTSPEDFSLMADVLNLPAEGRLKLELSPQRRRERTFGLLLKLLRQRVERQPVLMLLEDVHWSDASTMELFDLLIRELPNLRVLLVVSFRPEHTSPWIGQASIMLITLNRLTQRQSATLAMQVMQDHPLPTTVLDRVVALTDGVPLFVEELTRTLLEQAESDNAALTVPVTLQASLMARLDRIPAAKQVAQIAAVIGREAPHALLAEISGLPEPALSEGLEALIASGLAFRRGVPPDAIYIFKHTLVQEAAYESLPRSHRTEMHGAIGTALARGPETSADAAATIGHHFAQANQIENAADWYRRAGERSAERSATAETKAQLRRGLELAATLPESRARHRLEAELQLALGRTLMSTGGFADAEAGAAFGRASTLCRTLNDSEMLSRARWGEMLIAAQRGRIKDLRRIGEELLTLDQSNLSAELAAHTMLGAWAVHRGFLAKSQEHLQLALEKSGQFPENRLDFPGWGRIDAAAAVYLANTFAIQGFANKARTHVAYALQRVESADRASYAAVACMACHAAYVLGDFQILPNLVRSVLEISEQMGFPQWGAHANAYIGRLALNSGDMTLALSQVDDALAVMDQRGLVLTRDRFRRIKAECLLFVGYHHEALKTSDEMIKVSASTGIEWLLAEAHRLKGEALSYIDPFAVDGQFRAALAIARRQGARLWELHAALSLARLMSSTNRAREARDLLAPICDWFGADVSLRALSEARELLAQLPQ